ncbi:MAG: hypothetical protein H7836_13215 [Magnetococcus sp. YQC-3]
MILCRIKRNDRFEKIKLVSGKRATFTWDGTTYKLDPSLCYRTRWQGFFKVFALDYSKGNPNPINYFNAAAGGAELDFQLTPDLVAETYRKIIEGLNIPILILILLIISIVVTGVVGYLAYNVGQSVEGLKALLQVPPSGGVVP